MQGVESREEGPESPVQTPVYGLCIPPFPSQVGAHAPPRLQHTTYTDFLSG